MKIQTVDTLKAPKFWHLFVLFEKNKNLIFEFWNKNTEKKIIPDINERSIKPWRLSPTKFEAVDAIEMKNTQLHIQFIKEIQTEKRLKFLFKMNEKSGL